jgi:ATP-dependent Clp protease ATP-binding subunit ClpA
MVERPRRGLRLPLKTLARNLLMQLGQNYIGTEHILLGLVREGEGVGFQVLQSLGAELDRVRQTVVELLSS